MKKQIIPIAVVAVVLLAGLALWFGLRGGGGTPSGESASGVTIFAPKDTEIIVMEKGEDGANPTGAEKFIVSGSGKYNLSLKPGEYSLLVNRGEAYFPWQKDVVVTKDIATEFYPILFSQQPKLEALDSSDKSFEAVSKAFSVPAVLPTAEKPLVDDDETAELYLDDKTVYIKWLGEIADIPEFLCPGVNVDECRLQPIFTYEADPIENIAFYGKYNDVLILDRGANIMALEVDRRSDRNQQPIYKGTAAAFRLIDGQIYISDGGQISRVVLD